MSLRLTSTSSIDDPVISSIDGNDLLLHVDFDHAIVELAVAQLLAHPLARAAHLVADAAGILVRRGRPRRQQQIEQPLLGVELRLGAHFLDALVAHHVDRELDQIADHRLDVAADVADLGELRRFDLDERRVRELGEPPRDLGLADAGRADHQDVLRRDVFGQLRRQLLPPHAVAQRNRDRALGLAPGRRRTCRARRRSRAASANRSPVVVRSGQVDHRYITVLRWSGWRWCRCRSRTAIVIACCGDLARRQSACAAPAPWPRPAQTRRPSRCR